MCPKVKLSAGKIIPPDYSAGMRFGSRRFRVRLSAGASGDVFDVIVHYL